MYLKKHKIEEYSLLSLAFFACFLLALCFACSFFHEWLRERTSHEWKSASKQSEHFHG